VYLPPLRSILAGLLLTALVSQPVFSAPEAPRIVALGMVNAISDLAEDVSRSASERFGSAFASTLGLFSRFGQDAEETAVHTHRD